MWPPFKVSGFEFQVQAGKRVQGKPECKQNDPIPRSDTIFRKQKKFKSNLELEREKDGVHKSA
jgi:hypothetical protein